MEDHLMTVSCPPQFQRKSDNGVSEVQYLRILIVRRMKSLLLQHKHTLICHVNKPLYPQSVKGSHKMQCDPNRHEKSQGHPVDTIPGTGVITDVPLTPVKQCRIIMNQRKLFLQRLI